MSVGSVQACGTGARQSSKFTRQAKAKGNTKIGRRAKASTNYKKKRGK